MVYYDSLKENLSSGFQVPFNYGLDYKNKKSPDVNHQETSYK